MIENKHRYYFRNRPPSIGTHPKNPDIVISWYPRQNTPVSNSLAWGYVEYSNELTIDEINNYELFEDIINMPDKVKDLVKFVHDEGIDEALNVAFEYKEYGLSLNSYLKSIGLLAGSKQNIKVGLSKIAGVRV